MKRLTDTARRLIGSLPAGTAPVGSGLAILGAAAYVYLAIAGHTLEDRAYSDLAVLWMIVFSVGPGLFFPLEQELGRLISARRAQRLQVRPVVVRVAVIGGLALVALLLVTLAVRAPLADALFSGQRRLVDVLALNLVALTAAHLSRGLLAGYAEFGRYGTQLALDGVLRCALAVTLALAGVADTAGFGLVLAIAPLVAVAATVNPRTLRADAPGAAIAGISYRQVMGGMGLLVASSMFWLATVNASVITARLLSTPAEAALAGALLSGLVLARIPLFVFSSVQASLLPALSGAAANGDTAGFRRLLTRTTLAVTGLGLVGAVVCVAAGPWLVRVLFDTDTTLRRVDFAWLTVATTVYMVATVLGQAGLALAGHTDQAVGWAVGFLALTAVTFVPGDILFRVELAFLVGSTVAGAVLAAELARRLRRWPLSPAEPVSTTGGVGIVD